MWHGKDRLLCDGGYVDNLPISIMRAPPFSPGSIIAVDLEDRGKQQQDTEHEALTAIYRQSEFNNCDPFTHICGWRRLCDTLKFWREPPKIPTMLDIMKGLTGINHSRNVRMQLAAMNDEKDLNFLFLEVDSVYRFKLLDYDKLDEIASRCFEFSSGRIAKWIEALKSKQRQPVRRSAAMNASRSSMAVDTLMDKVLPGASRPADAASSMKRCHSVFFQPVPSADAAS
jgi:predicted acylesterase/phospholipase RssA